MKQAMLALAAGLVFGIGLSLSEMVNPARVIGFLDVAGTWDPTLALVMAGALLVTIPAYRFVPRQARPAFADRFRLPDRRDIDGRLVGGAALFGLGWGIAGLCPGPAITALASMLPAVAGFVIAMLAGYWLAGRLGG